MRKALLLSTVAIGFLAANPQARAVGCLSGGAAGALAGHMAGHGVLGAMGGCIAGHAWKQHQLREDAYQSCGNTMLHDGLRIQTTKVRGVTDRRGG